MGRYIDIDKMHKWDRESNGCEGSIVEYKNHKICEQCAYSFDIHIDASGKYLGCGCSPYKGKWVVEIEMCPLDKWSNDSTVNKIRNE